LSSAEVPLPAARAAPVIIENAIAPMQSILMLMTFSS
jgi:hypothetical protein